MPRYTAKLSPGSFRELAEKVRKYRLSLNDKCDEFTRQLAEEGVAIAKANILSEDARFNRLVSSVNEIEIF